MARGGGCAHGTCVHNARADRWPSHPHEYTRCASCGVLLVLQHAMSTLRPGRETSVIVAARPHGRVVGSVWWGVEPVRRCVEPPRRPLGNQCRD